MIVNLLKKIYPKNEQTNMGIIKKLVNLKSNLTPNIKALITLFSKLKKCSTKNILKRNISKKNEKKEIIRSEVFDCNFIFFKIF